MIGEIILLLVALILFSIFAPIGFIIGLFIKKDWKRRTKEYLRNVSLSIDQHGNVICKYLLEYTLIKKDHIHFGNPDETISSVLGKNKVINNLTFIGRVLDKILDIIDKNHSIKSIDETE